MFREILVPIDLSDEPSWQKALTTAIGLCQAFGARLHAITVVPDFGLPIVGQYFPEGYMAKVREETAQQLHALLAAKAPDTVPSQCIVAEGKIYQEILAAAEATKADLIVMGSHRPELKDYLLGPNAAKVMRHATCSVLVVRE